MSRPTSRVVQHVTADVLLALRPRTDTSQTLIQSNMEVNIRRFPPSLTPRQDHVYLRVQTILCSCRTFHSYKNTSGHADLNAVESGFVKTQFPDARVADQVYIVDA
jgi:hypothetical protein